ncbi:MAG: hypothetical protein KY454_08005 [Actinobacteria bacterium]|nr:hypothetical protein [Actinomycetota bacterium]MBW3650845.1 hypothetical protein [Actinomycetota bacterium]
MKENQSQTQDKATEGLQHLQAAAVEVIAALRSFLDLAEDVVTDSAQAATFVAAVADAARAASTAAPVEPDPGTDGATGVTRIRIS